ncbi:MAG: divalent-cation tolerance protein CutA [Candidatus Moraniibacteriota bacterium]
MKFIIIYTTHANMKEAKKVAEALLRDRLIACVNYFPIESAYWWKGGITNAKEIVSIVKTRKSNWAKVKKAVAAIHPYETPCIMKFEVEANKSYADWIHAETK